MSGLLSVAYVSTAIHKFSDASLEELLMECRRLNEVNSVTGVLLYNDGSFMQYFEGPTAGVATTYKRIKDSRRHKDITELIHEPVTARSFNAFLMGLARPTSSKLVEISTAQWANSSSGDSDLMYRSPGFDLLRHYWRNTLGK